MADELLEGFPASLRWPVAWGDMDSFGNVNNVTWRLPDEVRAAIEAFEGTR